MKKLAATAVAALAALGLLAVPAQANDADVIREVRARGEATGS